LTDLRQSHFLNMAQGPGFQELNVAGVIISLEHHFSL
jgi:hypothetical protein